jgi:ABC-2 type transport system permease protein
LKNPVSTPFGAIIQTEALLNTRRVAPYVMIVLFSFNAWLWTVKGAAVHNDWCTNCDYFIVRNLLGFAFMTLPLFTALIMGDPVSRDFHLGITPLIFSKPVSRATYLFGKFFGNFLVLIACQASFVLTMMILQVFPTAQMIVQPLRVFPYFKHFIFFVVISQLLVAAICFAVGTLTRNSKVVYGIVVISYPLYIAYQVYILKGLPQHWRGALDPLLLNWAGAQSQVADGDYISAQLINQLTLSYDLAAVANRGALVFLALTCLAVVYLRFSTTERLSKNSDSRALTTLSLAVAPDWLVPHSDSDAGADLVTEDEGERVVHRKSVEIPAVGQNLVGFRSSFRRLIAAIGVELRLLSAERGLIVILPLALLFCIIGMASHQAVPDNLYTRVYAARTAESLLIFLVAIAIFFTGEAMHRDRELRFEPLLWSLPTPNFILLLSKFGATFLLSISFSLVVCCLAITLQLVRGHTPFEVLVYLQVYFVILVPSILFMVSAVTLLNVLLRDKYLAYAIGFAISLGLFYLFSQGYNHWLYNPVLVGRWTPQDLAGPNLARILIHRVYVLALAGACLGLSHFCFSRVTARGLFASGRLSSKGWSLLVVSVAAAVALVTGFFIAR